MEALQDLKGKSQKLIDLMFLQSAVAIGLQNRQPSAFSTPGRPEIEFSVRQLALAILFIEKLVEYINLLIYSKE